MIDRYNEVKIPVEVEADGFITRVDDLEYTQKVLSTARLSKKCIYPNCEKCGYYREHYCTVPMVVSKQIYRLTDERIRKLENELAELKELVTDEILRSKEVRKMALHDDANLTWDDYLGEDR